MPDGVANLAVSLLNALALGRGASLPLDLQVRVNRKSSSGKLRSAQAPDSKLLDVIGNRNQVGGELEIECPVPPSRGFKTSSAVAAAVLRATTSLEGDALISESIACGLEAGITITGAYDDQLATTLGVAYHTNNSDRKILQKLQIDSRIVALFVPNESTPKSSLKGFDYSAIKEQIFAAEQLLASDPFACAELQSAAYIELYKAVGIATPIGAMAELKKLGATHVAMTGTGPGCYGVFDSIPGMISEIRISGGDLVWTRSVKS